MICTYLRSSSASTFEFCPIKYAITSIFGLPEPPNPKTQVGTICHKNFEILGKIKRAQQDNKENYVDDIVGDIDVNNYDFEKIMRAVYDYYYEKSEITKERRIKFQEKGYCEELFPLIFRKDYVKSNFYLKGKFEDGVPKVYPELTQRLKDLRNGSTDYTIDELIHLYREPDFRKSRLWTLKAIEYDNGAYDPRNKNIVDAEVRFDVTLDYEWAKYKYSTHHGEIEGQLQLFGTIDQISSISPTVYEIFDLKTGKRFSWSKEIVKSPEELKKDFQLRLYHYVCHKLYPNVEQFLTVIFFFNDGGPFSLFWGKEDLQETENMIREKFEDIKNTIIPAQHKSWKCKSFCHMSKPCTTHSHLIPIIETREGQMSKVGEPMSTCDYFAKAMQTRPMEKVLEHMTKPGHSFSYYSPPGA